MMLTALPRPATDCPDRRGTVAPGKVPAPTNINPLFVGDPRLLVKYRVTPFRDAKGITGVTPIRPVTSLPYVSTRASVLPSATSTGTVLLTLTKPFPLVSVVSNSKVPPGDCPEITSQVPAAG